MHSAPLMRCALRAGDRAVAATLQDGAGQVCGSAVPRRGRPAAALGGRVPDGHGCGLGRAAVQHATARLEGTTPPRMLHPALDNPFLLLMLSC